MDFARLIAVSATPKSMKTREIEEASAKDENLIKLRHCVGTDRWDECPPEFKCVRNELCVVGKLVLRGCRIVVPESLRDRVLQLAH